MFAAGVALLICNAVFSLSSPAKVAIFGAVPVKIFFNSCNSFSVPLIDNSVNLLVTPSLLTGTLTVNIPFFITAEISTSVVVGDLASLYSVMKFNIEFPSVVNLPKSILYSSLAFTLSTKDVLSMS